MRFLGVLDLALVLARLVRDVAGVVAVAIALRAALIASGAMSTPSVRM